MRVRYVEDDGFSYTFEYSFRGKTEKVSCDGTYFTWERYPYEYDLSLEEKRFFMNLTRKIIEEIEVLEGKR